MNQADRVFVQPKTYHQRGETNYDTRRVTIQVQRGRKQERDDCACWIAGLSGPCRSIGFQKIKLLIFEKSYIPNFI